MAVIYKVDLDLADKYKTGNIFTKIGSKKQQVLFRLSIDDFSTEEVLNHVKDNKNVAVVDYEGSDQFLENYIPDVTSVNVVKIIDCGNNITEEDIKTIISHIPEWVVPVIRLPKDFKNIRFLCEMNDKYPKIRFCGCDLFLFDGYRFGVVGKDTLKEHNVKFNEDDYFSEDCNPIIEEIQSGVELELTVSNKSERSSKSKGIKKKSGAKKAKSISFNNLLYGGGTVEL